MRAVKGYGLKDKTILDPLARVDVSLKCYIKRNTRELVPSTSPAYSLDPTVDLADHTSIRRRCAMLAPPPVAERRPRPAASPTARRPRPKARRARPAVRLGFTSAGRASGPSRARKGSVSVSRRRMACMVTGKWGEACCTHCTSCSCWMRFQIHLVGARLRPGVRARVRARVMARVRARVRA